MNATSFFAKEEELAAKSSRLNELKILLNMNEKDCSAVDTEPEEDTSKGEKVQVR